MNRIKKRLGSSNAGAPTSTFRRAVFAFCLLLACVANALPFDDVPLASFSAPPFWLPSPGAARGGALPAEGLARSDRRALVLPSSPLPFVAIEPCRQYDSRNSSVLPQNTPRTVPLTGMPCGIPATAQAAAVNITIFNITGAASNGVLSVGIVSPPPTAWINYPPTETQRGNAGVVALTDAGELVVQINQVAGFVDFVVDVSGYYAPAGIVNTLNALNGDVTLAEGANVTITPAGQTLTFSANSASANTANTLVRRDGSGNFSAGTITGNLTGAASANVLKAGDTMTGTLVFSSGNIDLVTDPSTDASGNILKNGAPFIHDFGSQNTFVGLNAGNFTMTGYRNTASGTNALNSNTTGSYNTATGRFALVGNTTGFSNTASGEAALLGNTTGDSNTAIGASALRFNTTGVHNTANGVSALYSNTTGGYNTASGDGALVSNTTGYYNTANGVSALYSNTTGDSNTATGYAALQNNTTGYQNIAIGIFAGTNLTTGSNNIDIDSFGVAAESDTIRIGTSQGATFIAGIFAAASAGGVPVLVNGSGQLGTATSSRRFKEDIADMDAASSALMSLRPVTFHYKTDQSPSGRTLQYGLIAEEVAEVYPGLVARSADGQIETVLYQFLPSMLLNEFQKQQHTIETQAADLAEQAAGFGAKASSLQAQIVAQRMEIDGLMAKLLESEGVMAAVRDLGARLARAEARLAETR